MTMSGMVLTTTCETGDARMQYPLLPSPHACEAGDARMHTLQSSPQACEAGNAHAKTPAVLT